MVLQNAMIVVPIFSLHERLLSNEGNERLDLLHPAALHCRQLGFRVLLEH